MALPINVVIADDNEDLCFVVEEYFAKRTDIKLVGKAYDGEQALKVIQKTQPDILLLDIIMPRLDGLAVLHEIQRLNLNLKTIMITAFGQEHVIQRSAELGAYYYLIKPFELSVLAKRILDFSKSEPSETMLPKQVDVAAATGIYLDAIGVPPNFKGYSYIISAVTLVVANWNILHSVTKHLYPAIGRMHQANSAQVERAIRHAIEYAWLNGDTDVLDNLFGNAYSLETGRPTNSAFIGRLAELVRQKIAS